MGFKFNLEVVTDASAAKAIASCLGLGKTRHRSVHYFCVQERVKCGDLVIKKSWGGENPADLLTKYLNKNLMDKSFLLFGMKVRGGRAASAPAVAVHANINCIMPQSRW